MICRNWGWIEAIRLSFTRRREQIELPVQESPTGSSPEITTLSFQFVNESKIRTLFTYSFEIIIYLFIFPFVLVNFENIITLFR